MFTPPAPVGSDDRMDISSDKEKTRSYCQWNTHDGKKFLPSSKTEQKLPPGVYEIQFSPNTGIYFEKIPVKTEGLFRFPDTNSGKVLDEIITFWNSEDIFRKYDLAYKRGILLWGPPGCHAAGTHIMLHDGSTKTVEDVIVGDKLIGPDGLPRTVLELYRGVDEMYEIKPSQGKPFVVNAHHVLNLRHKDSTYDYNNPSLNDINIVLKHYLECLSKFDQSNLKLRHISCLESHWHEDSLIDIDKITSLGEGQFYGFNLSDDHLYLTDDFIVHHNSGKSSTCQLIMDDVVKRNGVIIKFGVPHLFINGMRAFRSIQPDTPVVAMMEDIDAIIEIYNESDVLNILDGVNEVDKTIFLATTNYPDRLGARIVNRPSRFDKRFKIDFPTAAVRKMYFEHIIGNGDIKQGRRLAKDMGLDLRRWVKDTHEMSIAHLKELFIATVILNDSYDEAINTLKSMTEEIDDKKYGNFGFDVGGQHNRQTEDGFDDIQDWS